MKFSIIIPTYNRAAFLPKAIESVLSQTYTDWELIIVDDGSTDNTKDVVVQYNDERIKYIYQDNAERCVARNNGIEHASGDYVCFLDSDDVYLENYLYDLSEIAAKHSGGKLFIVSSMLVENNGDEKSIVCVSVSLLSNHRFDPRVVVSEDTKMWVEIMTDMPDVVTNDKAGVKFLFHDDNTINVAKRNVYKERKNTLKLMLREDTRKGLRRKVAWLAIDNCNFGIAKHYFLNRRYLRACNVILLSLLSHPANRAKEKMFLMYNLLINKKYC